MINKKILLIGGEGFIGRNIVSALGSEYDCYSMGTEKSIFTNRIDRYIEKNPYIDQIVEKFNTYIHLVDNNIEEERFIAGEEMLMNNLKIKPGKHLILLSSAVLYANPDSPYGKRKALFEKFYEKYCKENEIILTIFRLFNIYGEFQIPYKQGSLVANIMFNHINNIPIEINDLEAQRDFIYAKDMAKFVKYSIDNNIFGKMDLATENLITVGKLIEVIENDLLGDLKFVNKGNKEIIICPVGKNTLMGKVTLTSHKDGLTETFKFYIDNNDIIKEYLKI